MDRRSLRPSGLPLHDRPGDRAQAHQPELTGSTDAWHQLGNDYLVADAHNRGYVQLWSQDRAYQWVNRYEPAAGHYAGGYGYLRLGGRAISTLYADRPAGRGHSVASGRATSAEGRRRARSRSTSTSTRRSATRRCCSTT